VHACRRTLAASVAARRANVGLWIYILAILLLWCVASRPVTGWRLPHSNSKHRQQTGVVSATGTYITAVVLQMLVGDNISPATSRHNTKRRDVREWRGGKSNLDKTVLAGRCQPTAVRTELHAAHTATVTLLTVTRTVQVSKQDYLCTVTQKKRNQFISFVCICFNSWQKLVIFFIYIDERIRYNSVYLILAWIKTNCLIMELIL